MTHPAPAPSLVADIGGTNTRVALVKGSELQTETIQRFRNADYGGLEEVLHSYLQNHALAECHATCVAIAGPVSGHSGRLTNLDWEISTQALSEITKSPNSFIINDLQAQGHALGGLSDTAVRQVITGHEPPERSTKLVIGIGTGFNIAPVYDGALGRAVPASEAGHMTLTARTEKEAGLISFLTMQETTPAIEDALSGRGVENIYRWVTRDAPDAQPRSAADILGAVETNSDPFAQKTAEIFISLLGRVAADLTLAILPFGGVYFVGGVARAFSGHFDKMGLIDAFHDKGRFSAFMEQFPAYVVEDDFAALTGCARYLSDARGS